jgi:hypothetical protein
VVVGARKFYQHPTSRQTWRWSFVGVEDVAMAKEFRWHPTSRRRLW